MKTTIIQVAILIVTLVTNSHLMGQPCSSVIPMSCGTVYTANLIQGAGVWDNYTGTSLNYYGSEQVWSFTPSTTDNYTFNLDQGVNDADFFLMDACGNLAGNLSGGYWSGLSNMTVNLTGGTTYYLIADLYSNSANSTVTVGVDCLASSAPPNDLCSGATNLPCGTTNLAGTTVNSTSVAHGTGCTMSNYGAWYSFIGDGNSTTISASPASGYEIEMSISSGSCASLTNIVCRDAGNPETHTFTTTNGVTYFVYIAHWSLSSSTTGTFTISRSCAAVTPVCNDLSVNTTLFSQSGLTTCGSGDDFSSSDVCGSSYMNGEDFVIEYTPNTTECIDIALTNTNTWTGVFLTDGCPSSSSATCLGEATNSSGNPTLSGMNVVAGQTYYITISTYPSPDCTPFGIDITACPPPVMGQDCPGAEMVCSNTSFAGNSSGFGTQELDASNQGCLSSGEKESSWYYVNIGSNGTLEMTISPVASDDYDWAIWGPFSSTNASTNCPPTSDPIRCSYAGGDGDTGMGNGATDFSEGAGGNKWIAPLNVIDDEIYILLITNHSASSQPFNLNWGGTAGLDCTPISLPVELTFFTGNKTGNINHLSWETATETNNDYFILEHSVDGFAWSEITKMNGAGNSTEINNYSFDHRDFPKTINYYRLTQVDFDGKRETFEIVSIDNSSDRKLIKTVNMIGQEVNENYKGVVIDYYDDNTVVKRYQK
ncbi:hypothetical protein [Brumimicrobium sp.]|uniref:hypothetical protein n=1 Tax=Brumimicrobium sp. TaxID=2029867 RepID=UPI003A8D8840